MFRLRNNRNSWGRAVISFCVARCLFCFLFDNLLMLAYNRDRKRALLQGGQPKVSLKNNR